MCDDQAQTYLEIAILEDSKMRKLNKTLSTKERQEAEREEEIMTDGEGEGLGRRRWMEVMGYRRGC